jgi:hypothetical protein
MTRLILLCCFVVIGCDSKPAPTIETTRTSLFDGLYEIEIEKYSSTDSGITTGRRDRGPGNVAEKMVCQIGDHSINVVNGALSLNGKSCGTLQKGDQIRFTIDGKLYVNGVERVPQAP